ncbi:MAG: hypothetical protein IT256_05500 [Chitinophagaceae bacterium]|nr:hypothetical protein [Chitinophagaceae bacterium]
MNLKNKSLGINSILIAISTTIIATILHESAHYFTAKYFHIDAELHHNYVPFLQNGTSSQMTMIAAAGPLFSLIIGSMVMYVSISFIKPSLFKLWMTWLGMNNLLLFFGYILIAPIAKQGDTGKVFRHFGIPLYLSISIAAISFLLLNYLFGKWSHQFIYYKSQVDFDQKETAQQLFIYPIVGSIVIMTLLSFPIITWVSLLPTLLMPLIYFRTRGAYNRIKNPLPHLYFDKVSIVLWILTILTIALFRYLV